MKLPANDSWEVLGQEEDQLLHQKSKDNSYVIIDNVVYCSDV